MQAWLGAIASVLVIGAAYAADSVEARAAEEARATFSHGWDLVIDPLVRVAVLVSLLALTWFVLRGPRSRLIGLVMALIGFYVGLLPELCLAFSAITGMSFELPPLVLELLTSATTAYAMWAATGVMALGLIQILRPSPSGSPVESGSSDAPRPSASEGPA